MHFIYYPLSSCNDRNSDSLPVCYLLHIFIFISNYEFHLSLEFLKQHCNFSPKVSQKLLSILLKKKLYQIYLLLLQEGNINYSFILCVFVICQNQSLHCLVYYIFSVEGVQVFDPNLSHSPQKRFTFQRKCFAFYLQTVF